MKKTTLGVFGSRDDAEQFINEAHTKLSVPTDDISYIYRNTAGEVQEVDSEEIASKSTGEAAASGAKTGAVIGAIGGLAVVAGVLPVLGPLFVAGPLVSALGITGGIGVTAAGAVTGAAVGGLIGALTALGVGEAKAKEYQDLVFAGNILVTVHAENDSAVREAMMRYNAWEVNTYEPAV